MKNMKKRISFLLVLVMLFALLAVPANAVTIDGNKAIVTDSEIEGAILVSALSDTVTVRCPEVAMVSAVEISAKALAKVEATGKKLMVATAFASVEINHKAISSIVGQIKESTGETKGVVSLALELKAEGKLNDAQAAALDKVAHQLYLNVDVLYEGKSLALGSGYIVAKLPQMLVGDMIEQYVVAHLDENGKFEVVDTDYVNGYLQAKLDQLGIYVLMLKSAVPADNPFVDVAETDWFYAPVLWAVENNITGGISPTQFGPNNPCTRAQVVTFLYAAAGRPDVTAAEEPFEDVSESDWFYTPVLWAVENGITSGVDATHFGPNTTCNRAAVVTFLYAMKGKPEITAKSEFTDVADTDWFAKPVIWAVENKVTSGIGEGMFGPNNDCTRAAVVTFLKAAK
ncbi:MAG: S-layer homology domain-containing protein [Oscillospiraceae bacterium]|nr:S-layer homology domain-containing protein [Oscillospiraceae bacterium]